MNVLVYVFDALRADHLSCAGYHRQTTENLDGLAADGIRYENCFSPATWTKPVGASLLTGAYPPVHGLRTREAVFDASIPRLPGLLGEDGFTTAGFSTMGNVSASIGFDRGFDEFRDLYKEPDILDRRETTDSSVEELEHEDVTRIALPLAEDLTEYVCRWLQERDDDFFAFCWSIEPHIPYDPPEEFDRFTDPTYAGPVDGTRESLPKVDSEEDLTHLQGLYDGEILYNDHEFGRVLDRLKALGEYEETLIVALGDHGDAFNEHGELTHGHLPYEELIHVPLVIKPPASLDIGPTRVPETVSLVDVAPTILDVTGNSPPSEVMQGRVLQPFGPTTSSSPVYSETRSRDIYPAFYSVRTDSWKYMEVDPPDRDLGTIVETVKQLYRRGLLMDIARNPLYYLSRYRQGQSEYLYDLDGDPGESTNLIAERAEKAADLEQRLETWLREGERLHETVAGDDDREIDPLTQEQLKELGYVD